MILSDSVKLQNYSKILKSQQSDSSSISQSPETKLHEYSLHKKIERQCISNLLIWQKAIVTNRLHDLENLTEYDKKKL